jgi:hypothetical protein
MRLSSRCPDAGPGGVEPALATDGRAQSVHAAVPSTGQRVEEEIAKLRSDLPDALKVKEAELAAEQRRMANFVDFIGEGRGSQALAKALLETERRVGSLTAEVDGLRRSREKVFRTPPVEWINDRLNNLQEVLEQRTAKSARALRSILGRSGWS